VIKKIINSTFLLLVISVSSSVQAKLNVFACEPEWAALAFELGGDALHIYSATTSQQDPHHIQARPSLIAKARQADLLICTGAELETGWLPLLLRKAGNAQIQPGKLGNFVAADYVDMHDVPEKLDRSMGDVHAEGNPHIHTNPENILLIAEQLKIRLSELDSANSVLYSGNYLQFKKTWQGLVTTWKKQTVLLRDVNVVTHHNYWNYLNVWLGLNVLATLEPISGVSPSSSYLAKVKQRLQTKKVKMIMHVSYASDRPAQWLAAQIDVPVVALPSSVNYQAGQTLEQWFTLLFTKLNDVP